MAAKRWTQELTAYLPKESVAHQFLK